MMVTNPGSKVQLESLLREVAAKEKANKKKEDVLAKNPKSKATKKVTINPNNPTDTIPPPHP